MDNSNEGRLKIKKCKTANVKANVKQANKVNIIIQSVHNKNCNVYNVAYIDFYIHASYGIACNM